MTPTKICGLSTPETVRAALDGRAAYVGFMFFEPSKRNVDPNLAARLAEPARGHAKIVAVTVDPDDALLDRLKSTLRPDFIQLHGKETPERVETVRRRAGAGVIKVLSIGEAADLDRIGAYEGVADLLMLDAKAPPGSATPGGTGAQFDWSLTAGRKFARPWFLAGGLDAWNVVEAIRLSGAPLVDVSSGVERGPGLKDPSLISAFLDAVRRA
jgi:phosphoribosylanthranilate isomerase